MFFFFETKPEREATLLSIKHQNLSTIEETQHQIKERMSRLVTLFSVSCQLLHSKLHFEIGEGGHMHLLFGAQQQTTVQKHKKSHLCLIVANFQRRLSDSTFIWGNITEGGKNIWSVT